MITDVQLDERVRPAVVADVGALSDLERDARDGLVGTRGGDALLAELAPVGDWSTVVDAAGQIVVVCTIDAGDGAAVVGYVQAIVADGSLGRTVTVRQAYVHPEARELGFGSHMLDVVIATARAQGAVIVEGTALPGDRDTKNLYERAGITARKITVSKRLELDV